MSDPLKERTILGVPTAPGVAIGEVFLYRHDVPQFREFRIPIEGRERELARFRQGLLETRRHLTDLRDRLAGQAGETAARIFDAQMLILEDVEMIGQIEEGILNSGINAEVLVTRVTEEYRQKLAKLEGSFFHQRAQDVADIGLRIVKNLLGLSEASIGPLDRPHILVADDLLPSDVIHLMRENVVAVATDLGGAASHTAILTKSLEVPAVVGLKEVSRHVSTGSKIIVNGNSGKVIINPSPETIPEYEAKRAQYETYVNGLADIEKLPAETLDGRRIMLNANIELPSEAKSAIARGSDGIGLFRSEYLLLARRRLPNEQEQYEDYRRVIELSSPRPVTIRTFDIGGDKMFPDLPSPVEANPFMGWRAIRVCLDHPRLFRTQIRAILRAAVHGKAKIMFPLITGVDELHDLLEHFQAVKDDLAGEGIPFDRSIQIGTMIELPSAVILADKIAKKVDFFSIGTNDLTQFTLAVDRGNERVRNRYKPLHPAVVQLIAQTVSAGHRAGIKVALCGELAASPLAALLLIGLELDELSVSPVALPEIKKLIRTMTFEDARSFAKKALKISSAREMETFCSTAMKKRFANLPIWF